MLLFRQLFDDLLRQRASLRRERRDPRGQRAAVGGVEGRRDDVDPQHHARAAPVRVVVHLPLFERCRVAVAEQAKIELSPEDGSEWPLLGEPGERVRDEREDIDAQSRRRLATEA